VTYTSRDSSWHSEECGLNGCISFVAKAAGADHLDRSSSPSRSATLEIGFVFALFAVETVERSFAGPLVISFMVDQGSKLGSFLRFSPLSLWNASSPAHSSFPSWSTKVRNWVRFRGFHILAQG
jgi:hypothetical protein